MSQEAALPAPRLAGIRLAVTLAMVLSVAALALALAALNREIPTVAPASAEPVAGGSPCVQDCAYPPRVAPASAGPVAGGDCAWTRQLDNWIPAIGAEPRCQ